MVNIDRAQQILDEIAESLPEIFYRDLNGGIILLPDAKLSPHAMSKDLWILGEYHHGGGMGRFITIYYGSFMKSYEKLDEEHLKGKLRETLLHEFTHHLESLAGEDGLEKWDEEQLKRYFELSTKQ